MCVYLKWWVAVLLTCSGLMCSDVGKWSGYEGRSKTRSSASSCCWVKASALRCFRKLSTLPWESLCGPEPSEPSTRRKSNNRETDPGKLAFYFKLCTLYSPHVFSVPPLWGIWGGQKGMECRFFHSLMAVVSHWLHHTGFSPAPPATGVTPPWSESPLVIDGLPSLSNIYMLWQACILMKAAAAASPLWCLFFPSLWFLPRTLLVLTEIKSSFFFKAQFPFHNSILLSFSASVVVPFINSGGDKRLNKTVQSGSIIPLSKHRNVLLTPDLITRLLGEGCLSFSCCHFCATL